MRYREFGNTGMKVSELGFGAWAVGGNAHGFAAAGEAFCPAAVLMSLSEPPKLRESLRAAVSCQEHPI